ncbi:hypothetical protein JCM16814_34230 [Desulfobaculum senezii]
MGKKKKKSNAASNVAVGASASEIVDRFGSASAESIIGYRGVDNETGLKLNRGLKQISESKVHPDFKETNIRQQAGYSGEVAKVSRDNAENIIAGNKTRTIRTDDHPDFKVNDQVYDFVKVVEGELIEGSGSQMKVVASPEKLLDKIAKGEGGGKNDYSRYQGVTLEIPSDQVEAAKEYCLEQAEKLNQQADQLERAGKSDLAARKRIQAENFSTTHDNIQDCGITSSDIRFYREHPSLATARDICKISNRAGIEGAKYGAVVGGTILFAQNLVAVMQDDKDLQEAIIDAASGTAKAAGIGYGTGAAGSLIKSFCQQSKKSSIRALSKTALPALVVTTCVEVGTTFSKYIKGDIHGVQLFEELGSKGTGMLSGGMGATLGQIAIPIPVAGAVIGGMVGYSLSSFFYNEALFAFKNAQMAEDNYLRIKRECEAARGLMIQYRHEMEAIFEKNFGEFKTQVEEVFSEIEVAINANEIDDFCLHANKLASLVGVTLQFESLEEFDKFMQTDEPLNL